MVSVTCAWQDVPVTYRPQVMMPLADAADRHHESPLLSLGSPATLHCHLS